MYVYTYMYLIEFKPAGWASARQLASAESACQGLRTGYGARGPAGSRGSFQPLQPLSPLDARQRQPKALRAMVQEREKDIPMAIGADLQARANSSQIQSRSHFCAWRN